MACFAAVTLPSVATASTEAAALPPVGMIDSAPDVEQTGGMLCWAASAADILSLQTGQDAQAIYRSITEASGNTPGYVETAVSWYLSGAEGRLQAQEYCDDRVAVRQGFDSPEAFASALERALKQAPAVSLSLYPVAGGPGHAVTVYGSEREGGRLFLAYVDSSDGVQGIRRAEVVEGEGRQLLLSGTSMALGSLSFIADGAAAGERHDRLAPVGAFMHGSPLNQEYADLAENRGVYRFGSMPSAIMYRNGEPVHILATTPDYAPVADMGCYTLVDNGSYQITVNHNGMMSSKFGSRFVGSYAQHYSTIGIRGSNVFVFGAGNPYAPTYDDYKLDRMSRLVTDAPSVAYCTDLDLLRNIGGTMHYRVGGGSSGFFDSSGNIVRLAGAWGYGLTAGIAVLGNGSYNEETGVNSVGSTLGNSYVTCSPDYPLPSIPQGGDSGSPIFIYNGEMERFELVGVLQGGNYYNWGTRYNATATDNIINHCQVDVVTDADYDLAAPEASTYYISGALVRSGDTLVEEGTTAAYLRTGYVTLGRGDDARIIADYNGIALDEFAHGTWKLMTDIADSATWYNYDDRRYLNAAFNTATDAAHFGVDDLFYTSNLRFVADSNGSATAHRRIELTEDVDLGIGRVQFSLGSYQGADGVDVGLTGATFDIGMESADYYLSSAGFVVDKGVTVNNYFTYEKGRELRRTGEGVMNIVGSGCNDLLLNIGAGGLTYLDRTGGYGALSALVNTRAVLKLHDVGQVYNNVTLGVGGGVLDFNGNDFMWVSGDVRTAAADGKEYFGLTVYGGLERVENSYVANYAAGTVSTITIGRGDDFEFAGAFRDGSSYATVIGGKEVAWDSRFTMMPGLLIGEYTQYTESQRKDSDSALRVVYDGHATMTMTGVYTVLTGSNARGESGFEVASGSVVLRGTNTIHALGSESGLNHNRWQNPDDWHFAMAEMDVQVGADASFVLGDHALLIGDVQVQSGGRFVVKQAVNERYEHVEGWYELEDTYGLADYYGHKGDVGLAQGAAMEIRFDDGVATALSYAGNISGKGSLTVALGKGSATLGGKNTFSGEKGVESGHLRLVAGAEGDTSHNKWLVGEQGSLALESVRTNNDVLRFVAPDSTGVLALVNDFSEQLPTAYFPGLIVGAAEGETVHYGSADAVLQSHGRQWTLGGGGGTLIVDFLLRDNADGTANKLVLGNRYGTGTVVLTNEYNSFTGGIDIVGNITLEYTSVEALGGRVGVSYGNVLSAPGAGLIGSGKLDAASDGVFALADGSEDIDLVNHGSLSLGAKGEAVLTGRLMLAEGAAYRFGGAGSLTVATELTGARDITIDGQGRQGSRVIFGTASTATGAVTVQGYDADKLGSGGVTLSFTADNAIAAASSLTLGSGATIDLFGTDQVFHTLHGHQGSLVTDSSAGGNTLTLVYHEDSHFEGTMQLAGTDVVKTGAGDLTLSGEKLWKSLTIAEGSVSIADGKSIGYLATGSQGIAVTVEEGATLHMTRGTGFSNELRIAGFGDGADRPYAVQVDNGTLDNAAAALILQGNAGISGSFNFKSASLNGFELHVGKGLFNSTGLVGDGGSVILGESGYMTALNGSDYTVRIQEGAYVSLDAYDGGAAIASALEGGSFYMGWSADAAVEGNAVNNSTYRGHVTVGEQGGLIANATRYDKSFHLAGGISGTHAGCTLRFGTRGDDFAREVHVDSSMLLAGHVELENAAILRLNGRTSIGGTLGIGSLATAVIGAEAVIGGLSGNGTLRLDGVGALMEVSGGSFDFAGTLEVLRGTAMFDGQAGGGTQGRVGTLILGADGILALSQIGEYSGDGSALLNIGSLVVAEGSKLALSSADMETLGAGRYHLISSAKELTGLTLANTVEGSRREFSLVSAGSEGNYTLDLVVTGARAQATWQGTGTLVEGVANTANLTTDLAEDDHSFFSQDALTITTAQGATETLTLGSLIHASTLVYNGAGTMALAQENGGMFSRASILRLAGKGTLDLGGTTAVGGEVVMESGTLKGQGAAINAIHNLRVTGDASLALTDDTAVDRSIDIGGTLSIVSADGGQRTLSGTLGGAGTLRYAGAGELLLKGNTANFTGEVRMDSGTLKLGDSKYLNLNLGAGLVTMGKGTRLELNAYALRLASDIDWGKEATLQVTDGNGAAAAASGGGYNYLLTGEQRLAGQMNIYYNWGKSLAIEGIIRDAKGAKGSLVLTSSPWASISGGSNLTLYGENTYSGGTVINSQYVTAYGTNAKSFGTGDISLTYGTLAWKGVGESWDGNMDAALVLGNGNLHTNGFDVVYRNRISGSGSLNKIGAGSLTLTGELGYTGGTNVNAGSLVLGSKLASTADVTVAAGAGLVLQGANLNGNMVKLNGTPGGYHAAVSGSAADLSSAGSYQVTYGHMDITAGGELRSDLSAAGGGLLVLAATEAVTLSGTAGGGLMLGLVGDDFTISGSNSHSGGTEFSGKTLTLASASALGLGALYAHTGSTVQVADGIDATIAGKSSVDTLAFGEASRVSVGTEGTAGSLSFGSTSGTAHFELDIYGLDSYDRLVGDLAEGTLLDVTLVSSTVGSYQLVEGRADALLPGNITLDGAAHDSGAYLYNWSFTDGLTLTIDYNQDAINLWTGETGGDWDATSTNWNSGNTFNTHIANTLFRVSSGNMAVDVTEPAYTTTLITEVGKDATLTFNVADSKGIIATNALVKEGEGTLALTSGDNNFAKVEVNAGTLAAHSADALGSTRVTGAGTLALIGGRFAASADDMAIADIRLSEGATLEMTSRSTLSGRNLEVGKDSSLRLGFWCNLNDSSLTLKDGGSLVLGSVGLSNNVISVEEAGTIAVGQATDAADYGVNLDVNSTIRGAGTLTICDYTDKAARGYTVNINREIANGDGATLSLIANQADLHLRAASTYSGGTTLAGGKLTVHHADALGTGAVSLEAGTLSLAADLHMRGLSGTGGSIVGNGHDLRVEQRADATFSGSLSGVDDFVKTGGASLAIDAMDAGSLVVEQGSLSVGRLHVTEALTMTVHEGDSLAITQLTLAAGAHLVYNNSQLASVGQFTAEGALTLDLDGIAMLLLESKDAHPLYDLGLDLSGITDLTVKGLDSSEYHITHGENGHSFISLTDSSSWVDRFRSVSWDPSWSSVWDVTTQPTMARKVDLAANLTLKGSEYDEGGSIDIAIDSTAGDTRWNISGTASAAVNADLWVDITAGNFGRVAMGSDNGASFDGDTHLQAGGGSFDMVLGGNYGNGSFTGDSFVSLGGEAQVHRLIAGGSYSGGQGARLNFTGNSHINIRNLQPADGAEMTQYLGSDFVAGGHVVADLANGIVRFDGHTHVGLYLDDDVTGSFSRHIAGGNVSMGGTAGSSLSQAHVGSVFLHVGNGVVFDKVIAGGHYAGNALGQFSITGMSQVTISGGHYLNSVTAGTYLNNMNGASQVDIVSSSLQISGGIYDGNVSGGSIVRIGSSAVTTFTLDDVHVLVSGGHLNKGLTGGLHLGNANAVADIGTVTMVLMGGVYNGSIVGGIHAATASTRSVTGSVENVAISLKGATVNGNIYGGALLAREAANAELRVGNIGIDVYAGTLNGNIYAAGTQRGDSALVVGDTHVTLAPGASYADGIVVSGGFENGLGTVTGTRSLTLQGTTELVENGDQTVTEYGGYYSNIIVRDFDRVTNAGDVGIARLEGDKEIHKAGAGTLTVGSLGENSRLVVDAGALRLGSVENLASVGGNGALLIDAKGSVQAADMMQKAESLTGTLTMESGTLAVSGEVQTLTQGIHMDGAGLSMADGASLGGRLVLDSATTATVAGSASLSADISGSAALSMAGAGTLTLSGNNSIDALAVNSGTVVAGSASALGSGAVSVAGGATLALDAAVDGLGSLTLADGATLALNGSLGRETVLGADSITLGGNLTLRFNGELTAGESFTLAGSISGQASWDIVTDVRSSISTASGENSIVFTIDSVGAASLSWAGGEGATWNNAADNAVWMNGGSADHFVSNDLVSFGQSGDRVVAVAGEGVQAGKVSFTADGYQLTGGSISTGAIAVETMGMTAHLASMLRSEGGVTYSGEGMLVLEGGQDIGGSLDIGSGYVQLLHSEGLRSGVELGESGTLVLNMAGQEWLGGSIRGTGTVDLMGTYRATDLRDAFVFTESGNSFRGTVSMEGGSRFIMDADLTAPFADVTFKVEQGSGFLMDTERVLASDIELSFNGFLGFNRNGALSGTVKVDRLGTLYVGPDVTATLSGRLDGSDDGGELTMLGGGLLEIGGIEGTGSLVVQEGNLSVGSAASLGSLTLVGGNTLSLVNGQLLTVKSLELGGHVAFAFAGELEEGSTYTLLRATDGLNLAEGWQDTISLSTDVRQGYELSMEGNEIRVTIGKRLVGTYTWVAGADDNIWDTSAFHMQWDSGDDGLADSSFFSRDSVTFGTGGTRTVEVGKNGVTAADMLLSNGGYSFSGGAIAAANLTDTAAEGTNRIANNLRVSGTLTKSGSGTLELSGDNSFGAIELSGGRLVAASDHAFGHDAEVEVSNGAELYVTNGANVHNALSGDSFIIGAEAGCQGSFTGAAAASLLASGFTKEGEGRVELVNRGSGNAASIHINAGTLAYDAGSSTGIDSVSGEGLFELTGGTLTVTATQFAILQAHFNGGSLVSNSTLSNRSFELSNGSSLQMNYGCNLENASVILHEGTALRIGNSTFSGNMTVDGEATIVTGCWGSCTVAADISGVGTLKLSHWVGNVTDFRGVIADGAAGSLAIRSDHSGVTLSGANTYTGGTTIAGGILTANNATALGSGSVELAGGTLMLNRDLQIGTLSGTAGTVDFGSHRLTVVQESDASYTGHFTGSGTLVKAGAGTLTLDRLRDEIGVAGTEYDLVELSSLEVQQGALDARNLAISGTLHLDMAAGADMHIDSLTLRDGATLSYIGSGNYAAIGSFTVDGGLHLELSQLVGYLTTQTDGVYNAFDLGLDLGDASSYISVNGQEAGMYQFGTNEAGHTTISLTADSSWVANYLDVAWDANWGAAGLAGAPEKTWSATLSAADTATALAGTTYDNGKEIAVSLTGTEGIVDVYATKNISSINAGGGTLERNAWLRIEGGHYGIVAGAYVNNYNGGQWNFKGDLHYLLTGSSVNEIVGLSPVDGAHPVFEGSTYITVGQGVVVNDSIVGAGAIQHVDGMTLRGNTNVFVYSVQSTNEAAPGGSIFRTKHNAVIGGYAYITNSATSFDIQGSTNVTIDVADYAGDYADFVKNIYGGNVSYGCNGTITGSTGVSITGQEKVTFTGDIVAGSRSSGTELIEGDTTLRIGGGVFGGTGKYLTGGSYVSGGSSTIEGTASVILTGGTINRNVYAAGIATGGSSTVGASLVELGREVHLGSITLSGGFSQPHRGTVTGASTLLLHDGVAIASDVTVRDFSHIRVDEGSAATLASAAALGSFAKTGAGELKLDDQATTSAATAIELQAGRLSFLNDAAIGSLSGNEGTQLDFGSNILTVNQGVEGSLAGSVTGGSFTKLGDAALELGSLTLSGTLNANGHTLTIGSLTLLDGATITYNSLDNATTAGSFTALGSYSISLGSLSDTLLDKDGQFRTLDLGMDMSGAQAQMQVSGMTEGMYIIGFDEATGHSTLTLTDKGADSLGFVAVHWDSNWGIADAPSAAWETALTAHTGFYDRNGSRYDNGERIAVSVNGTGDAWRNLYATINSDTNNSGGTLVRDAWLEVTGGTYGVIAGANINNWGNGGQWNVQGDIHLMLHEGTADLVVGLSPKDGQNPTFTGDSYVSIGAGFRVNDSIVGGGVMRHARGINLVGDTNVFVYGVQDTNASTLNEGMGSRYNAIIGGSAWGSNTTGLTWSIDGNTNVTVDVSAYEGETAGFVKAIYGGHASQDCNATITGDANVRIDGNGLVTFTQEIAAGSLKYGLNNTVTILGDSTLTIDGGVFGGSKAMTGGSAVHGGTSTIEGQAAVILNGGSINRNVYAAGITYNTKTSTVGSSRVEVGTGVQFGTMTLSGGFSNANHGTVTGESTLVLRDGVNIGSSVTLRDFSQIEVAEGTSATLGSASALSNFTKTGGGTLYLGGRAAATASTFTVDGGRVVLTGGRALGNSHTVTTDIAIRSGTLDLNGQKDYGNVFMLDNNATLSFTGDGDMLVTDTAAGSKGLGLASYSASDNVAYTGTGRAEIAADITHGGTSTVKKMKFNIGSAGKGEGFTELTVSGNVGALGSDSMCYIFGIDKMGEGSMMLSGNNAYTGGTAVTGGKLIAASDSALGTGALAVASGATLEVAAGTHLAGIASANFANGATLSLMGMDADTAAMTATSWTLGGSMNLHLGYELAAGTYKALGGLNSAEGITITGQEGFRYKLSTELVDSTYYITVSDFEGAELHWTNGESSAVWNSGQELWEVQGEAGSKVGSSSKDTVVFSGEGTKDVQVAEGGVRVDALRVEAEGYSFLGGQVNTTQAELGQETTLAEGASFSLGEVYTISQNGEAGATMDRLDLGADAANKAGHIHGIGGALARIDHALIDIEKGVTVNMRDVLLTQHSRITDDPATVNMERTVIEVGDANTRAGQPTTLAANTTLLHTGDLTATTTLGEAADVYQVYCTSLDSVDVTGSSLTLDMSGLAASIGNALKDYDYVAISFGSAEDGTLAHFDTTGLSVSATFDQGQTYNNVWVMNGEQSNASTLYVSVEGGMAVPEPTTATLSLLALAALAMRRRRR